MSIYLVLVIVVSIANISLGFTVYSRNHTALANKVFLALSILLTIWMLSNFALQSMSYSSTLSNAVNSIAYATGFMAIYAALLFSHLYPITSSFVRDSKKLIITSSLVIFFSIISATTLVAGEVYQDVSGALSFNSGPLEFVYTILSLAMVTLIILRYTAVIKTANNTQKSQALVIMSGLVLGITVGLFGNLILPELIVVNNFAFFGPITTLVFISLSAYAITRHDFFDIRPFVARTFAYTFSITIILGLFVLVAYFVLDIFILTSLEFSQILLFALLSIVLAIVFQPTKKYFDKLSKQLFFRDSYNAEDLINKVNYTLVNARNLSSLLSSTVEVIEGTLLTKYCNFYLVPDATVEKHLAGSNEKMFGSKEWLIIEQSLIKFPSKYILATDSNISDELHIAMSKLDLSCCIQMSSGGEDIGHMLIGDKKSGNAYSQQDVQVLEIVADEVAIAVQNALRFEEISKFTITLQKKIEEATAELQKTNEKLRTLDEAKDEFISMASHQLRTPLTSIKGYISMMLEGDAGEINEQQQNFLNQAFISSQRMVYLIADLLNVSRLKTGKFMIETTDVYLPDVVATEVDQLITTSEARGLKLKYKKPKIYPTLQLDETKTRQVIMNFIDNAIYYTPKGGTITLELKTTDKIAQLTVTDNGIGVPKHEQHQLFTKFYRAGNAKKARPDGTGLGLFMAKKVIVAQGGTIIFKSTEGKGSTFGFSFPLPDEEPTS